MYKVFFKDRTVFFINNIAEYIGKNSGLFYKYDHRSALYSLIDVFFDLKEFQELYLYHEDPDFLWSEFSSYFRIIEAAGGLVKNDQEQTLFIRRRGIWDLPKGKLDDGENPEQAALREVEEECGIKELSNGDHITDTYHTYRIGSEKILKKTYWFKMRYHAKKVATPQREEDITEIKWLKPADIEFIRNNTFPSILEVLNEAGFKF